MNKIYSFFKSKIQNLPGTCLILFILFFANSTTYASDNSPCCQPPRVTMLPKRIFSVNRQCRAADNQQNIIKHSNFYKSTSSFEITKEDLLKAYSLENDLEYYATPDEFYTTMDIGTEDLNNPQHWVIPEGLIKEENPGFGVKVDETTYSEKFPEATHCMRYYYPGDEDYYEYYQISDESAYLLGIGVDYLDENDSEVDTMDFLMAPLNLNLETSYQVTDTLAQKHRVIITEQEITPYGFGTLTIPSGDIEVIVFRNECYYYITENGSVTTDETTIIFTFVSKDGHQFSVWLEQGSDETGEVDIEWMEYTDIIYNSTGSEEEDELPLAFTLHQNYPNPFNPTTNIKYELKESGHVTLAVYDELGKEISILMDGEQSSGNHEVQYDGSNLSSGVYYCRLTQNNQSITKKLMLMK